MVVAVFEARIVGGEPRLSPEATEIQAFAPGAIPWAGIGFKTTYFALVDWLAKRRPDLVPGPAPTWRRWEG